MGKKLFIVESPAKAKTIKSYLGKDYTVVATMGHIKDLPPDEMGVDLVTFEPKYVFIPGKKKIVDNIVNLAKNSELVILASDKDREGEMISYHLKEIISKHNPKITRVEFTEITKDAILNAIKSPRDININLVNAQKTRRILDRIVGYTISPVLYKTFKGKFDQASFSAGRVQSPALKLVCEREIEIKNFVSVPYYDVYIRCEKDKKEFLLKLVSEIVNDKEIKFSPTNRIDEKKLKEIEKSVDLSKVTVLSFRTYKDTIKPLPPFKTSTLQQDASAKLGFSPSKTMKIAQELYEGMEIDGEFVGLITYMRTDSVRISEYALKKVRDFIKSKIGEEFLPLNPRVYESGEGAQEAHECIRPTDVFRTPDSLKGKIPEDHHKLYELIWKRFVACQMKDAVLYVTEVLASDGKYNFFATSKSIVEENFLKFYPHSIPKTTFLPSLKEGERLNVIKLEYKKEKTQPPPRYTEATLIKKLEEEGIGRPSTYATIISTLLLRKYVIKKNKSLIPTKIGFEVYEFLKNQYPSVVDLGLTAHMESLLDKIEKGENKNWKNVLIQLLKEIKLPI